uniref:ICOS ligand n=1 Tax=Sus scrofa TaxID=9823 RepID=A0A8D1M0W7_PIG
MGSRGPRSLVLVLPRPGGPGGRGLWGSEGSRGPSSPAARGLRPTMRLRSPRLLLLLFCGLRAVVAVSQEREVRAMVGSDVRLACVSLEEGSFDLNDVFVYWQISEPGKANAKSVVTYYLPENSSAGHSDNHYRDRAWLSLDSMRQGDFSLHLHNVTPQDEQKFNCLVFRKSLELRKILDVVVSLHVAANYSMPVVSGPSQDEELTFTCTSTNGYPRPNVYWINRTDGSLLDGALQSSTVSLNARGLYDVVSVLRIGRAPSVNVGCCIENVLLHQNLTSKCSPGTRRASQTARPTTPSRQEAGRSSASSACWPWPWSWPWSQAGCAGTGVPTEATQMPGLRGRSWNLRVSLPGGEEALGGRVWATWTLTAHCLRVRLVARGPLAEQEMVFPVPAAVEARVKAFPTACGL